jgi:hypothetical protein
VPRSGVGLRHREKPVQERSDFISLDHRRVGSGPLTQAEQIEGRRDLLGRVGIPSRLSEQTIPDLDQISQGIVSAELIEQTDHEAEQPIVATDLDQPRIAASAVLGDDIGPFASRQIRQRGTEFPTQIRRQRVDPHRQVARRILRLLEQILDLEFAAAGFLPQRIHDAPHSSFLHARGRAAPLRARRPSGRAARVQRAAGFSMPWPIGPRRC